MGNDTFISFVTNVYYAVKARITRKFHVTLEEFISIIYTISVICNLDHRETVYHGYSIKEYKVYGDFKFFVTPRCVKFMVKDECPNLLPKSTDLKTCIINAYQRELNNLDAKYTQKQLADEVLGVKPLTESEAEKQRENEAIKLKSKIERAKQMKTLTPYEFADIQKRILNCLEITVPEGETLDELSATTTVQSSLLTDGKYVTSFDVSKLPISINGVQYYYSEDAFAYPLEKYLEKAKFKLFSK